MERGVNDTQPKWQCSDGFEKASCLYNYWFVKDQLYSARNRTDTIVLIKGPGDCWRLEEKGIHNSVALLGINLTRTQQSIIEMSRALNIVVLLDNDEAGLSACQNIKQQLGRQFRLFFFTEKLKEGTDVGDLNTDEETAEIKSLLSLMRT